jgi:hypothetical protein
VVDRFVQQLILMAGRWYGAVPLLIEGPGGEDRAAPRPVRLTAVTMYNLEELATQVEASAAAAGIDDQRLERALGYLQHALWLFTQRAEIADPFDANSVLLIASVFLNLWKAASTIVGDPSTDSDYQRRYRTLGFDREFFVNSIEPLRAVRNNYDVAHYHLDTEALQQVDASFGASVETVRRILTAYDDQRTK